MLNLHSVLRNNGERRPSIIKYGYIPSKTLGTMLSGDGPHALSHVLVVVDTVIAGDFQLSLLCAEPARRLQHDSPKTESPRTAFQGHPCQLGICNQEGEGLKHD